MIKKILTVPNPALTTPAEPIVNYTAQVKKLAHNLVDTLNQATNPPGVGLAAPQIGILQRIFVIRLEKSITIFVNPKIITLSPETIADQVPEKDRYLEGCLSIPHTFGFVNRPYSVTLTWHDETGREHQHTFTPPYNSYILHENDHLDGILFTTRTLSQKHQFYTDESGKLEPIHV